jgi:hypothetical protein
MRYYLRVFKKAWGETALFSRRKLLVSGGTAIVVRYAHWLFDIRVILTAEELLRDVEIIAGSYGFVWLLSFVWNFVGAPVLLDQEKSNEVQNLDFKIQSFAEAEKKLNNKKEVEAAFAVLIQRGQTLVKKLETCGAPSELENYTKETEAWKADVIQELKSVWPTDAPAFEFAKPSTPPLTGPVQFVHIAVGRTRQAKAYVGVLEEIVKRRV